MSKILGVVVAIIVVGLIIWAFVFVFSPQQEGDVIEELQDSTEATAPVETEQPVN